MTFTAPAPTKSLTTDSAMSVKSGKSGVSGMSELNRNDSASGVSFDPTVSGVSQDKSDIADLVARYGTSSATAWLEFAHYQIWRPSPSDNITQSSFPPVQGYMRRDPWVFAWGNPLVSDPSALEPTAVAFVKWAQSEDLKPVWCCINEDLQDVLAGDKFKWSAVSCIVEDVLDPAHVVDIAESEGTSGGREGNESAIKDLKKNLRRAEKAGIEVKEIKANEWTEEDKVAVEQGIKDWKKSRHGIQLASTSMQPWLDSEHRRYWLARKDGEPVGIFILAEIRDDDYQIKNSVSFPKAPKGTSEELIFTALKDLHEEQGAGISVTFGITASDELKPVANLSGWKITWLSKTYKKIASGAGLLRRGDFRNKFDSEHAPMYVCYPTEDGFGLDGVNSLLKMLRK